MIQNAMTQLGLSDEGFGYTLLMPRPRSDNLETVAMLCESVLFPRLTHTPMAMHRNQYKVVDCSVLERTAADNLAPIVNGGRPDGIQVPFGVSRKECS